MLQLIIPKTPVLKSNGSSLDTKPATANYTYNHTNITSNQNYELE
jgi:hypothetical protein